MDFEKCFQEAQSFALIPMLKLLNESIDYENKTGITAKEPGHINIRKGDVNAKAYLDLVAADYNMMDCFNSVFEDCNYGTLSEEEGDSENDKEFKDLVARVATHLIQSAYIVFDKFKDEEIVAEHKLNIDNMARMNLLGHDFYISVKYQKL